MDNTEELEKVAKELRNEYQRERNRLYREKKKEYNKRYWLKKAKEKLENDRQ